jgi:hypothetical protein
MKTRRQQRGGMNCIRGICKRITNKVKSYLPIPEFPAYEKPTLDNEPPGVEFYEKLSEYITQVNFIQRPSAMIEAFGKIKRFIESTDADPDILNELKKTQSTINAINDASEKAEIIFRDLMVLLEIIIDENNGNPNQEIYFIGYEWTPQIKAKLYARSGLASAMIATGGNLGKIVPGGPGPEQVFAEYLGGRQRTNNVKGTTRRRRHSVTAKNQIDNLKRIGTAKPGESVGKGRYMFGPNGIIQNSVIHL